MSISALSFAVTQIHFVSVVCQFIVASHVVPHACRRCRHHHHQKHHQKHHHQQQHQQQHYSPFWVTEAVV
jgi:multidrug efflux pump subunit AcrB